MRKVFFLVIFATASLCAWTQTIIAQGACGDSLTWVLTSDSTLSISGRGAMADYNSWGIYKNNIDRVVIGDSVTSIGISAFQTCTNLVSVSIGNSVISIGRAAFRDCNNLISVTIPDSVTSIGDNVFYNCSSLTSIHVSDSNIAYTSEDGVLLNKSKTILIQYPIGNTDTNYTIPNSVTTIENSAFYHCLYILSVAIPDSVIIIGDAAFGSCLNLVSVSIGNNVTTIGQEAFLYCKSLTSVTIPNSVTSIGYRTFLWCHSLKSVTLSDNLTSIEDGTFTWCDSLTSIIIPNSVTIIKSNAFNYCYSLASVTIGNSVDNIAFAAFDHCSSLTSITIPNSVKTIGAYAFRSCNNLTSMTLYPITPPDIYKTNIPGSFSFENVPANIPIYIPCGTYNTYNTAFGWDYFSNFIEMPAETIDTGFYSYSFKQGEMYNDANFTGLIEEGLYYKSIACDSVVCLNLTYQTSIVEMDNYSSLRVYPNPTKGKLTIENGELRIEDVELFDVCGKSVLRHCEQSEAIQIINISHLSTGMYFLQVKTEKGIITKKVIKE